MLFYQKMGRRLCKMPVDINLYAEAMQRKAAPPKLGVGIGFVNPERHSTYISPCLMMPKSVISVRGLSLLQELLVPQILTNLVTNARVWNLTPPRHQLSLLYFSSSNHTRLVAFFSKRRGSESKRGIVSVYHTIYKFYKISTNWNIDSSSKGWKEERWPRSPPNPTTYLSNPSCNPPSLQCPPRS